MKGWTTPAGVTWSSRSCAISENCAEKTCARSSGEYRDTGKPEHCVGPSLAKVAITESAAGAHCASGHRKIASAFVCAGDEVEDRTIVQHVVVPIGFPTQHIVMHEVNAARLVTEPRVDLPERLRCDVEHGEVRETEFEQTVHKCGGPAADVHDSRQGSGRYRFDQAQGRGWFALIPAQLRVGPRRVRALPRFAMLAHRVQLA